MNKITIDFDDVNIMNLGSGASLTIYRFFSLPKFLKVLNLDLVIISKDWGSF